MRSFNFVVTDLVRNSEGELLAVSFGRGGFFDYHRTTKDGTEIDESHTEYYFKRKADIKKIRASKDKDRMIDRLNLWILQANVDFMALCLEQAEEHLFAYAEKTCTSDIASNIRGDRWYDNLPDSMKSVASSAQLLSRGSDAYGNVLNLCFAHGGGAYHLKIERRAEK